MAEYLKSKWTRVYRALEAVVEKLGKNQVDEALKAAVEAREEALLFCRGEHRGRSFGVTVARTIEEEIEHLLRGRKEPADRDLMERQVRGVVGGLRLTIVRETGVRYEAAVKRRRKPGRKAKRPTVSKETRLLLKLFELALRPWDAPARGRR